MASEDEPSSGGGGQTLWGSCPQPKELEEWWWNVHKEMHIGIFNILFTNVDFLH